MQRHKPGRTRRDPRHGGKGDGQRQRLSSDRVLLYGLHAVEAALANPERAI